MGIGLMNFYNNSNSEFTDFITRFQSYVHVITQGIDHEVHRISQLKT